MATDSRSTAKKLKTEEGYSASQEILEARESMVSKLKQVRTVAFVGVCSACG